MKRYKLSEKFISALYLRENTIKSVKFEIEVNGLIRKSKVFVNKNCLKVFNYSWRLREFFRESLDFHNLMNYHGYRFHFMKLVLQVFLLLHRIKSTHSGIKSYNEKSILKKEESWDHRCLFPSFRDEKSISKVFFIFFTYQNCLLKFK